MLSCLHITDFVIADRLELVFDNGLQALTGETGAGKSIIVDALGLILGDRADSDLIRQGAERAEISAHFDLSARPEVCHWLTERDLAAEGECLIRRVITHNGRSRGYINGCLQPLTVLRELGEQLVDIHSQHAHQSLLRREVQRELLDLQAGSQSLAEQVRATYQHWQRCQQQWQLSDQNAAERAARLDLLIYQIQELDALAPNAEEPEHLAEEQRRLAGMSQLVEAYQQGLAILYDAEAQSAHGLLSHWSGRFEELQALDQRLTPIIELLTGARVQLEEAAAALQRYGETLELDPERLQTVEQRLDSYYTLARKHRCEPPQLAQVLDDLQQELDTLRHGDQDRETLAQAAEQAQAALQQQAQQLTRQRQCGAIQLGRQVSAAMQELGMQGGAFQVALQPLGNPSVHGLETVEFQVSTNPGQPPRSLAKVASGGELSRISLAIQVIVANSAKIPTLVFDEVDSGIGGAIAEVIGRRLRQLGRQRQVLCVTHLPQVAAQANQHYLISKLKQTDTARTQVVRLDSEQRVAEIARMLGGLRQTQRSLAHAREMIELAERR